MFITYRSLKTNFLSQGFYENKNSYYAFIGMSYHGGYDFVGYLGEPIYWDVSVKGTVLNLETDNAGGLGVNVITDDEHGIYKHRFWHLKDFSCQPGQVLETGDLVGHCDTTGLATGSHLHRDMKEMVKDGLGNYQIKDRDNGSFGTVPIIMFENIFVKDKMAYLEIQVSILQSLIKAIQTFLSFLTKK